MKDLTDFTPPPQAPLRPPSQVMRLARMGSMFPTRLSFLRSLMRRLAADEVQITRPVWQMCPDGFGQQAYKGLTGFGFSNIASINQQVCAVGKLLVPRLKFVGVVAK